MYVYVPHTPLGGLHIIFNNNNNNKSRKTKCTRHPLNGHLEFIYVQFVYT